MLRAIVLPAKYYIVANCINYVSRINYFYAYTRSHLKPTPDNIIISRTDSIGDVVLTLPVAAILRRHFPGMKIAFMGRSYTRAVITACKYVDQFIDVDDFLNEEKEQTIDGQPPQAILHVLPVAAIAFRAKRLGIPLRIGTTNRSYHWLTCNSLVRLSRKNSDLHEAQLNARLLAPLGARTDWTPSELGQLYGLQTAPLKPDFANLLQPDRYNLILHPKSQGHGREWPLEHFIALVRLLPQQRYRIFVSGTAKERERLRPLFDELGPLVTDITGMMDLSQFIAFINAADGLIASGTGPIHLAAALGRDALGIFPPIRPVHPGRWAPLGPRAQVFVLKERCAACKDDPIACSCMTGVQPQWLAAALDRASSPVPATT